jgi:rhodanese-related sulfurtransferase
MNIEKVLEFVGNHWMLAAGLFIVTLLLVQDFFDSLTRRYRTTTPAGAVVLLNNDDTILIDVRESAEFAKGHIENALPIPLSSLDGKLYELEQYKQTPVIVTCQQGSRSSAACKKLHKAGFTQVYDMKGGMLAWEDAKLPINRKRKK